MLDEFWAKEKSFPLGSQKSGLESILDSPSNPPSIFEYETSNDPPPIPPVAFPVNEIIEAEVVTSDNNKSKNVSQSFVGIVKSIVNSNIYSNMDDNNKKAMDVMESQGPEASMKHMFTRDDGSIRSYAEMRALYG